MNIWRTANIAAAERGVRLYIDSSLDTASDDYSESDSTVDIIVRTVT